jgi:hypothetical protein
MVLSLPVLILMATPKGDEEKTSSWSSARSICFILAGCVLR